MPPSGPETAGPFRDARIFVKLKERKERIRKQEEIQRDLRDRVEKIPGILPAIVEVGRVGNEKPLMVNVRGEDIALLKKYAAQLKEEIL